MIMKILTTMRSKLIIISILYPLVKLMTLSLLLEMFELFNTVLTKSFPLQHFLQKHVRDVHLALSLVWCGTAFKDVGAPAMKSRRGRLSMITWMSFQLCDKFELCDAVNLLTLWFRQSIGDYVVPDWHTEF